MAGRWGRCVLGVVTLIAVFTALAAIPARAGSGAMVVYLDQATLLRLATPAERVIVGNPDIANVNVDSPRLISVFGKAAGQTNLIVLGAEDKTILSRSLIVVTRPEHTVSVHVPGKNGPSARVYTCIAQHCQLTTAGQETPGASASAGAPTTPAAGGTAGTARPGEAGGGAAPAQNPPDKF